MNTDAPAQFSGFTPEVLAALTVAGVNERWSAVQERLHPTLVALAEALRAAGMRQFPRAWPLYEVSFRSLRFVNRGPNDRAPIDDYHFALDRPPRGCGILVAVSGAEQLIIVGLQITARQRKDDLRWVWEEGRAFWQPLIERGDEVRFVDPRTGTRRVNREPRTENQEPRADSKQLNTQNSQLKTH